MKFRMKADITFEADGIDDALHKLMVHFSAVYCDMNDEPTEDTELEYLGVVDIFPMEDQS